MHDKATRQCWIFDAVKGHRKTRLSIQFNDWETRIEPHISASEVFAAFMLAVGAGAISGSVRSAMHWALRSWLVSLPYDANDCFITVNSSALMFSLAVCRPLRPSESIIVRGRETRSERDLV